MSSKIRSTVAYCLMLALALWRAPRRRSFYIVGLFELGSADWTKLFEVPDHAFGNPRHVGNFRAAKFERIFGTGHSLFVCSLGLRVFGERDAYEGDHCCQKIPSQSNITRNSHGTFPCDINAAPG